MGSVKQKHEVLLWVSRLRSLQLQKAELDTREKLAANACADLSYKAACQKVQEVHLVWQERMAAGEILNPLLSQLWKREIGRLEAAQVASHDSKIAAKTELKQAQQHWNRSLLLRDQARRESQNAQHQMHVAQEESSLSELSDIFARRKSVT